MADPFITYNRPLVPPGSILILLHSGNVGEMTVSGDAASTPHAGRSEIGTYEHPGVDQTVERLMPLVERALASAKEVAVRPGTRLLSFGHGKGKKVKKVASFPMKPPLPEVVEAVDEAILDLMGTLLDHPVRTMAAAAGWSSNPLTKDDELEVSLTLTNSGRDTIEILNPAVGSPDDDSGIHMQIMKDLPPAELDAKDRSFLDLNRSEVTLLSAPGFDPGDESPASLALAPGEAIVLKLSIGRHVYMQPGRYRGVLRFHSTSDGVSATRAVEGVLTTSLGTLVTSTN